MYNVFLVDDDILVRTNIKLMLKDCAETAIVCGEASNGALALSKIKQLKPQVVISDIKMPEMDGLELCKILHKELPDIYFIALSNYDDYDYVRGTLKNGAADYLLKHELTTQTIMNVLNTLPVLANSDQPAYHSEQNLLTLRNKFVLNLLSNEFKSLDEVKTNIKFLDIPLALNQVIPIVLSIDNYFQILEDDNLKKRSAIEYSVVNISDEILSKFPSGIMTHIRDEKYCLLLSFSGIHSEASIDESLNHILHLISSNLSSLLNISVSFSIGKICSSILQTAASFEEAVKILKNKFYSGNQSYLNSKDIINSTTSLSGLDYTVENKLKYIILTNNTCELNNVLRSLFSKMMDEKVSLKSAQMVFADLIGIITRVCKDNGISLDDIFIDPVQPSEIMTKLMTLAQIESWFKTTFLRLCNYFQAPVSTDSRYVQKTISYINANYKNNISLQSVAETIGISSGYLSTIFKKETSQGFTDYLNSKRIEHAKASITSGNTNLHKISSECGFQSYEYFFKVFKKKLNYTPKEYIKKYT